MDRPVRWLLAAVFGVSIGTVTYVALIDDPLFAGVTALFWALGVGLSVQYLGPQTGQAQDWTKARWSGAAGGLTALAATLGISPTLPITSELRLALGLFVVAIWLTAVNIGLALGLETTGRR